MKNIIIKNIKKIKGLMTDLPLANQGAKIILTERTSHSLLCFANVYILQVPCS